MRIVTINTWCGWGPYEERMELLGDQLAALEPDVVACQEVFLSADGAQDTAATLGRRLGLAHYAYPSRRWDWPLRDGTADGWFGLAVLSRYPVRELAGRTLPSVPGDGERIALFAGIEVQDDPSFRGFLRLAVLHSTHLAHHPETRIVQMQQTLNDPFLRGPATARVLCGDLNMTPEGEEWAWLRSGAGQPWTARDTYELGGGGEPSYTFAHPDNPFTAGLPPHRLDYIVDLGDGTPSSSEYRDARVVLNQPGASGIFPSDHLGVAVDLVRGAQPTEDPTEEPTEERTAEAADGPTGEPSDEPAD